MYRGIADDIRCPTKIGNLLWPLLYKGLFLGPAQPAGGTDPGIACMPVLHMVLQGVKRSQAMGQVHPITANIMRTLRRSWEQQGSGFKYTMLWVACCTCFFGFLRSGEATVPSRAAYDPAVHLSWQRTPVSSHSQNQSLEDSRARLSRTGAELCPVAALLSYIAAQGFTARTPLPL